MMKKHSFPEALPPAGNPLPQWPELRIRLAKSAFRSRFKLGETELRIIAEKGMNEVEHQCRKFILRRLTPAAPLHDGRQTPMRGHPCFIAQHATGCCCRGCLRKWHGIPEGRELNEAEIRHIVSILTAWIREHADGAETLPHTPNLF